MPLTPADVAQWWPKDGLARDQVYNRVDAGADAYAKRDRRLDNLTVEQRLVLLEQSRAREVQRVDGLRDFWPWFVKTFWNRAGERTENEIGQHVLSDPVANYAKNGNFPNWNGAASLPDNWTQTGTVTLSRQTRRTGARSDGFACRLTTAGATGGIEQTITGIQLGNIHTLGFWVYFGGSDDTLTVAITTSGAATNLSASYSLSAATVGASAWLPLPTLLFL